MASPRSEPGPLKGLDEGNNPAMDLQSGTRNFHFKMMEPIRDVVWRDGPQEIDSGAEFRAAHGQRCGMVAPEGEECGQCARGLGVFASCVVNVVNGELQVGGACMNCAWRNSCYRCSFRKTVPDWIREYALSKNRSLVLPENKQRQSPCRTPFASPSGSFLSPSAPRMMESPFSPYATGMDKPLTAEWYSSPLEHLDLQENLDSMKQIRLELLTARQRLEQDISWLTAQIERESRNVALRDLLNTVMSP